ncbi:MAG TPA: hypothetical protein VES67_26135 [Vicinamibacterales bacterium]|nr:hypothetical protein [Vicinamibacterales bacterium]
MSDRISRVEARLQQVDEAVACLARRLEALEDRLRPADAPIVGGSAPATAATLPSASLRRADHVVVLQLVGRTLIVLGGAYLLRALTQSGQISTPAGVVLGLLYAGVWLAAADRAAAASALFYGLAAVLVALPIVWEGSTRFQLLSPIAGAITLAAVIALTLGVAWHRQLRMLALTVAAATFVISVALAAQVGQPVTFAAVLLGFAAMSLWVAYQRRWMGLAVLTALAIDVVLVALAVRASVVPPRDPAISVLALQAAFVGVYLASFAVRSLVVRQPLGGFEFAQAALALAVGLGGAVMVTRANGLPFSVVGTAAAIGAVAAYTAAFTPLLARRASISGWYFFSSLGLVLAVIAGFLLLPRSAVVITLGAGAIASTAERTPARVRTLTVHSAITLVAAGYASGLFSLMAAVWLTTLTEWPPLPTPAWTVMAAALLCFVIASLGATNSDRVVSFVRTLFGALVVAGLCSVLILQAGPGLIGAAPDAGGLATLKSIVLAAAAVLLAWTRRVSQLAELSRLTYPLLIAGGLKILLEDLASSRPATLFVAFALYGAALILAPRVLKSRL